MTTTTAPSSDLTVVGGAGGTRARLEDLHAAAATLDRTATELGTAAARMRELSGLIDAAARWSPSTASSAWSAALPLSSPMIGLGARSARVGEIAADLRSAAAVYERAELDATEEWRRRMIVAGQLFGEAGPRVWLFTALTGGLVVTALGTAVVGALVVLGGLRASSRLPVGAGLPWWAANRMLGTIAPLPGASSGRTSGTPDARAGGLVGGVPGGGLLGGGLGGSLAGPLAPLAQVLAALRGGASDLSWLAGDSVEVAVAGMAAFLRGAAPGTLPADPTPVPEVAGTLGTVLALRGRVLGTATRGLVVAPLVTAAGRGPTASQRNPPPPTGVGDVLRQIDTLYPVATAPGQGAAGGPPGTVGVQRLDHPDGTTSWVVTVPGTQEWSPAGGPNPMDLGTNLDAMAGRRNDVAELVREAMRAAGVPPDEPVLLAGHSQGGMVAMQLAQDRAMQEEFSVTTVITAGSPVGNPGGELASGVQAMHLESLEDLVWAVDGAPNPDDPQRTTVRGSLTDSPDPADRAAAMNPVTAHDVGTYARLGDRVDALDDPSVQAFRESFEAVVGGPGTTASTQFYMGVQVEGATSSGRPGWRR